VYLQARVASVATPPRALLDPKALEPLLPGSAVFVGPAFIGYTESVAPPVPPPVAIPSIQAPELQSLRSAVTPTEWRHANLEAADLPLSAVLTHGSAISAAGFERLLGRVAHIGVLTHPAHRGYGHARRVVSAVALRALAAGLLPQYQTLLSNRSALSVARALGFTQFVTTLSCRWGRAAD
jgi:GNAT superfamily N-acetyltransferase